MKPYLNERDRLLCLRFRQWMKLKAGKVVVIIPWVSIVEKPGSPLRKKLDNMIKRVAYVPGDYLPEHLVRVSQSQVMNGGPDSPCSPAIKSVTRIPSGMCFVIGDNTETSIDSREWGFVPIQSIMAVGLFKLPNTSKPTTYSYNVLGH